MQKNAETFYYDTAPPCPQCWWKPALSTAQTQTSSPATATTSPEPSHAGRRITGRIYEYTGMIKVQTPSALLSYLIYLLKSAPVGSCVFKSSGSSRVRRYSLTPIGLLISRREYSATTLFLFLQRISPIEGLSHS